MGWKQDLDNASTLRARAKEVTSSAAKKTLTDAANRLEEKGAKGASRIGRRKRGASKGRINEFVR